VQGAAEVINAPQLLRICKVVAVHFGFDSEELQWGRTRSKTLSQARQLAMFLTRERLHWSLPEIGYAFSRRDHTTVLSACKNVRYMLQHDASWRVAYDAICQKLDDRSGDMHAEKCQEELDLSA
jgi:chromosomal replication initiator protein